MKSLFLVSLCIMGVAACGSSSKASAPAKAGNAASTTAGKAVPGPTITISTDLKFSSIPVNAGGTVTVRNDSAAEHTVSADSAAGGFDIAMEPGKTMTFTAPSKPGVYKFHCNIHTFMHGTLQVT